MGCDIHLYLEMIAKKDIKTEDDYLIRPKGTVRSVYNIKNWGDRNYGMFAKLADIRNYHRLSHIPIRGLPKDISYYTYIQFLLKVLDTDSDIDGCCHKDNAESWVKDGYSKYVKLFDSTYVTDPDLHSYNWCTTKEMEESIEEIFFNKDKNKYTGDYISWLGLLGMMQGIEKSGEYECRAVFAFDN